DIREREVALQQTRLALAASDSPGAVRRLIDVRGAEMFGKEWNTSVQGGPTLSHMMQKVAEDGFESAASMPPPPPLPTAPPHASMGRDRTHAGPHRHKAAVVPRL